MYISRVLVTFLWPNKVGCKVESKKECKAESKLGAKCRNGKIQLVLLICTHFWPVFWVFISKLSSLSYGILFHHQLLMLLSFIFLFDDKFYNLGINFNILSGVPSVEINSLKSSNSLTKQSNRVSTCTYQGYWWHFCGRTK